MPMSHLLPRKTSVSTALVLASATFLASALLLSACTPGANHPPTPPPALPPEAVQPTTQPAPTPATPPNEKERPAAVSSKMVRENGIVVREFALQARPDNFEGFNQLPVDVWEDLNDSTHGILDRWGHPLPSLADLNDALTAWDMGLRPIGQPASASPEGYELLKGDQAVSKLNGIHALSRSQDGRRALFVAEGPQGVGNLLFLDGKLQDWDVAAADFVPPIFHGNTLLSVTHSGGNTTGARQYAVRAEGQTEPLYTFDSAFMTDSPIHGFYSTGDQWILEYEDHVVVSGQDLGKAKGYDKVFAHRHLVGRPFYLFQQGGRVSISFDGTALSPQYDEVLHNRCCEPAIANPRTSEIAVRFFARRGERWYYVSALVPAD